MSSLLYTITNIFDFFKTLFTKYFINELKTQIQLNEDLKRKCKLVTIYVKWYQN